MENSMEEATIHAIQVMINYTLSVEEIRARLKAAWKDIAGPKKKPPANCEIISNEPLWETLKKLEKEDNIM